MMMDYTKCKAQFVHRATEAITRKWDLLPVTLHVKRLQHELQNRGASPSIGD